jgi:hypothetical protein
MHAPVRPDLTTRTRDLRVDLVRGIAIWFLFADHIPHNAVNLLTLRNFGFSGATDLFVFIGGYAAARLYGQMAEERGFVVTATRILKRVGQLYAAYVVLFVIYVDIIGQVAAQYAVPDIIDEYNVTGIVDHPVRVLAHGLMLQAKPLNLDTLQLVIPLMAAFPLILAPMLRWPKLTLAASVALYFTVRQFDLYLGSFPDGRWYFNPFSWQLLFVLGAWFAVDGGRHLRALQEFAPLRMLALAWLVFALLITTAGKMPQLASLVPDALLTPFTPNDKENLAAWRVLHLLALAFLFTWHVPRDWPGLRAKILQSVIKCGDEWLACFCAGVFLSLAGHLVLIMGPNSLLLQVLVSAAGAALMTLIAWYVSWSRQQDGRTALGAQA